uniref:Mic1 domain-containing protein n=1 Tax=Romanomermis culicivorax TaxID=13658 RepID=A0A915I1N8_ROMCU
KIELNWFIDILFEYVLSLEVAHIPVQSYIQELLVTSLIKSEQFDRLSQLIRNDVVTDSKPMAFLLLSLEGKYPPALQLAMQLLSSSSSVEEIVEILLSKQLVLEALRYIHSVDAEDKIEPMKLVEAAYNKDDMHDFYVIFSHFEQQILKTQSPPKSPDFEKYLAEYKRITNT